MCRIKIGKSLLEPQDLPRRMNFAQWIISLPEDQLLQFLFSDEANFELSGHVNTQNVRRYTEPVHGGRPTQFVFDKARHSTKLMGFEDIYLLISSRF